MDKYYIDSLNVIGDYAYGNNEKYLINMDYMINHKIKEELHKKYFYKKQINKSCEDTILSTARWVYENLLYKDYERGNIDPINAVNILSYAKYSRKTVNCLMHAVTLTQCLLALDIKSRYISCLPMDGLPYDNHVVVEAYVMDKQKWVLIDPSFGLYITDKNGMMLSLVEFRTNLLNNNEINLNFVTRFKHVGARKNINFDNDTIINLYLKNMFVLEYYKKYGNDFDDSYCYRLVPTRYLKGDISKKTYLNGFEKTLVYSNNIIDFYSNNL